jgi:hypothetical protein
LLGLNPTLNHVLFSIQQSELPPSEELGEEEKTSGDAQEGHEGESNGDRFNVHDTEDTTEEDHLEESVLMDAALLHVLGEDSLRVSARLHEEEEESVPEFNARKRGETHEQEDTVEDRKGKKLEDIQEEHGQSQHSMGEEHGQSSFLNTEDVSMRVLVSKGIQVNDARNSGGNQPRTTNETVDAVEDSIDDKIVVVGFSMS